ncbi:HEXXH motif domain-containing protein [Planobispora siamensis]|uniref:HEXXH motif-containing protein n=1 Tax=Planobispora siamensis TaxID=936338 RepID=A0A8J3SK76_9ACTN|nr:HEXXH motif domain-containing protein [Planobispora siamensis]GIH95797.1 hypothetical protein Psi01_64270 [Planobispora siamensis]
MTSTPGRVSDAVFAELAAGGGGAEALRALRAFQRWRTRLLVRGVVEEAKAAGHQHADLASHAYDLLEELETRAKDAIDAVLGYPAAGAWAWRAYQALAGDTRSDRADLGRLGALALASAIRAGVACEIRVPLSGGTLMLPSLGEITLPGGAGGGTADITVRPDGEDTEVRLGRSAVRVNPSGDGTGWRALGRFPVTEGFGPALDDLDPYRWPVDRDVAPRLTAGQRRTWGECLGAAWRILAAGHRTVADEVASAVTVLVPLRSVDFGQNSASARESFGAVALSEPRSGLGLAATFAHEIQHVKLTALIDMVDLTVPDDGRRYYAPWRPDPRPASGLLQGAYAFMGVADFWRRRLGRETGATAFRARVETVRWREGAYLVTGTLLRSGCLTERGEEFVAGMRRTLEAMLGEPADLASAAQAHREAEWHRDTWNRRNAGRAGVAPAAGSCRPPGRSGQVSGGSKSQSTRRPS